MEDKRTIGIGSFSGLLAGVMFASQHIGLPLATLWPGISVLPLLLVAFMYGSLPVLIAGITSVFTLFLLTFDAAYMAQYVMGYAIPVVLFSTLALRERDGVFYPTSRILLGATFYACGCFIIYYGMTHLFADVTLYEQIERSLTNTFDEFLEKNETAFSMYPEDVREPMIQEWGAGIKGSAFYIPVIYLASAFFVLIGNAWLAQVILHRQGKALRPSFHFEDMRLPHWYALITVLSILGAIAIPAGSSLYFLVLNLSLFLSFILTIEGFALVHHWAGAKGKEHTNKRLIGAYVIIMILLLPIALLFVWALIYHLKRIKTA